MLNVVDDYADEEARLGTMYWDAQQLDQDSWAEDWKPSKCDLVLKIRRPQRRDVNSVARDMPIPAFDIFSGTEGIRSPYYLKFDAGLSVAHRRVEAAYRALQENEAPENQLAHLLKRDVQCGSGFSTLLRDHA